MPQSQEAYSEFPARQRFLLSEDAEKAVGEALQKKEEPPAWAVKLIEGERYAGAYRDEMEAEKGKYEEWAGKGFGKSEVVNR